MANKILVTGATGTVGSATVKALSSLGAEVRAGVRSLIKGDNLKRLPGVETVELNFSRPENLAVAFTGVGAVFLITPFAQDQVEMAQKLIDAAKGAGVKHVVRLSVIGADAEPSIQIGRWHRQAEEYLKASGLPYTLLRPGGFMQNFVNQYATTIKENNVFYQPNGEGRAGYIDVRDIGAVAAHILMNPSEHAGLAYTLTGPQALSGHEVAEIFTTVLGRPIHYKDIPEDAARTAMQQQGLPDWMTESLLELSAITRAGYTSGLTSTVQEMLGREPHTFQQFVEAHKDCF
ncbi:SDR family oxidoreductase [Rufibacter glacialis]|uniref:SDR family oxidoreductase n=1 Tax=Rufibacter glacialis TaxID=1259555 RepID=A0A5M8QTM8_9BACT|nr:SDR family oxidoreductase [Rufibacter glacialis]KAA6437552.1 SDR family oxidoreductase [Rufibacter glacialis]GGK58387.1 NAD(P)-dependent oxidoreductase [Rufibacter glacialis]